MKIENCGPLPHGSSHRRRGGSAACVLDPNPIQTVYFIFGVPRARRRVRTAATQPHSQRARRNGPYIRSSAQAGSPAPDQGTNSLQSYNEAASPRATTLWTLLSEARGLREGVTTPRYGERRIGVVTGGERGALDVETP